MRPAFFSQLLTRTYLVIVGASETQEKGDWRWTDGTKVQLPRVPGVLEGELLL